MKQLLEFEKNEATFKLGKPRVGAKAYFVGENFSYGKTTQCYFSSRVVL